MIEGAEQVGGAITGAMIARAIEPGAGEAAGARAGICLNCGSALAGAYCHRCGQAARVHRTLTAWWHDLAHGVLHLDGKVWRTLPLLAWRPGELTRRYIDGERARFVSPIALLLFSVFLMFAVIGAVGGPFSVKPHSVSTDAAADFRKESAARQQALDKLRAERARVQAAGGKTAVLDARIGDLQNEIAVVDATSRIITGGSLRTKAIQRDGKDAAIVEDGKIDLKTGWPPLDAAIGKANDNPSLLLYKIQTNAYKLSWALIPISVPFVWLLFLWRREHRIYDHVVFVTYSIAFMSLGLVALSLLRPLGLGEAFASLAVVLVPPIHMYRQLRGAYRLSRFSALWRTAFLLVFAGVAAILFLTLLVALGAFT